MFYNIFFAFLQSQFSKTCPKLDKTGGNMALSALLMIQHYKYIKTKEDAFASSSRCGRDSNPRPHAWQACILTNWTTAPIYLCRTFFSKAGAKVLLFFDMTKFFEKKVQFHMIFFTKSSFSSTKLQKNGGYLLIPSIFVSMILLTMLSM